MFPQYQFNIQNKQSSLPSRLLKLWMIHSQKLIKLIFAKKLNKIKFRVSIRLLKQLKKPQLNNS